MILETDDLGIPALTSDPTLDLQLCVAGPIITHISQSMSAEVRFAVVSPLAISLSYLIRTNFCMY